MSIPYACHCCFDWREDAFHRQHGLLPRQPGLFLKRHEGSFLASDSPMLLKSRNPVFVFQGHRDCLAIRALFHSWGKEGEALSETERLYRHSHGEVLHLVKKLCSDPDYPPAAQLAIFEKACVVQNIKNVFDSFVPPDPRAREYTSGFYAFYSLSDDIDLAAEAIPLMVFDPDRLVFVGPFAGNAGIRLADLHHGAATLEEFKITRPPDLAAIIAAEAAQIEAGNKEPLRLRA